MKKEISREEEAIIDRIKALATWLENNKPRTWVIPNFWTCRASDLYAMLALIERLRKRDQ